MARGVWLIVTALVVVALATVIRDRGDDIASPPTPRLVLTDLLRDGAADAGFARALAPRPFAFPDDHGPHPEFRTEWWYFTGNLRAESGEEFGYQLTLFRQALAPTLPPSPSAWRSNRIWLGHFAITDLAAQRHEAFERFNREAFDLAGGSSEPVAVWLDDWRIERGSDDTWHLRAHESMFAIDLIATPSKPPVSQGEAGLSRKSTAPGNASYYYSLPRLDTRGRLTTSRGQFEVTGSSWLDREWSTSALGADQIGWDWFALQLDDGTDLMLYRLRRADGSIDPASAATLSDAAGNTTALAASDVVVTVTDTWQSPTTGTRYPIAWRIEVPTQRIDLDIAARLPDQEMNLALRYWEGAVTITGRRDERTIGGLGYVELTGY